MSLKGRESATFVTRNKSPIKCSIGEELKNIHMYFCENPYSILSMDDLILIRTTLKKV